MTQRTAVKMKPLMTVPQSESNGFFKVPLLGFVVRFASRLRVMPPCPSGETLGALEAFDGLRLRDDRFRVGIPDQAGRRGALFTYVLAQRIVHSGRCGCLSL